MNLPILIFALIISLILHYSIQRFFIYYKKFDDFNHRSSHKTLATRTGGIGVFLALLIICVFYYIKKTEIFDYSLFIPLSIMFVIGVYDDFYNADFKLKFFLQIIVAKILIDQGFVINNYNGFLGLYEIPWLVAQLTTIFVFLLVVNAINFIDGIDGLALTQVIKSILLFELFSNNITDISILGFIVIASLIPLFYFNFKKKGKIFLGDSGSMLLGSILMIYILYLLGDNYKMNKGLRINKTLFSILIVLYPLIDLLRVFLIRISKGSSPFVADKNHIHHKLLSYFKQKHYLVVISILIIEIIIISLIAKFLIN